MTDMIVVFLSYLLCDAHISALFTWWVAVVESWRSDTESESASVIGWIMCEVTARADLCPREQTDDVRLKSRVQTRATEDKCDESVHVHRYVVC